MKFLFVLLLATTACGDDTSPMDAMPAPDMMQADANLTVLAGACPDFAAYYCDALLPCGDGSTSRHQCIEVYQNYCCGGAQCAASAPPLQSCYDAIDVLSCNQLVLGAMPSECAPFQQYGP